MYSIRSGVTTFVAFFSLFGSLYAVPLVEKLDRLSPSARDLLKRSTPAAPHFLAYNDKWLNPFPSSSDLSGFNVFAVTFLMASGAVDQAQNWEGLTSSQRSAYLSEYNAAGISLIVSAFGSTETPTSSGYDPVTTANTMAAWVIQYGLQGIDVDYEDFAAFDIGNGSAETWLISFTQQLRTQLPQGNYILTHAPVAPWFSPNVWSGGGYLAVHKSVGSMIDWYNVQFYNQGSTEYTTCAGLLTTSSSTWPETALFQISANGVTLDKLVIGKPATSSDASNGYIDPSTLATCVSEAAGNGWYAGVMVWQYPDATSSWIATVRGTLWPVSRKRTASSSGSCADVSAWDSIVHVSGDDVTYK
ncbi:glycoside hydrolase family 18 protein [Butyriboletus roseoflavus]|nr:glycoside hydrolase family 18 protein [Butyriboletus roseoflavus]